MAAEYRLTAFEGVVQHLHDGTVTTIPEHPDNTDWIKYQEWLTAGGVPDQYVVPYDTGQTFAQRLGAN
jgi:hypothetical protein